MNKGKYVFAQLLDFLDKITEIFVTPDCFRQNYGYNQGICSSIFPGTRTVFVRENMIIILYKTVRVPQ